MHKVRKVISSLLVFSLIISLFSIMSISVSATIGDEFTVDGLSYTVTDEVYGSYYVTVTGFDDSTTDVVIPEKVANEESGIEYTVNGINSDVFNGNTNILSVNIPGTIKELSTDAFGYCESLKNVTLNEGIELINGRAFRSTSLEKIEFPKSLQTVNTQAFDNCVSLSEVYINSDVNFNLRVFSKCTSLVDFYCYSSNITFVGSNIMGLDKSKITFHGYAGSTAETFANAQGCSFVLLDDLTEPVTTEPVTTEPATTEPVTEPDTSIFTWKTINDGTAIEITGLKDEYKSTADVEILSEINGLPVTSIGESAFEGSQVANVTVPSSVIIINNKAFKNCGNLATVTFAENSQLQKIGNEAFYRTEGAGDYLNTINLPESLKQIGYRAFYNRANLVAVYVYSKDVYFGDAAKGTEVFDLYTATSNLKLYGYTGSTAEAYAAENNHTFRYLDLDTTELQALYDQAKAIDSSLYTEESYKTLSQVMIKVDILLHNSNATPTEVAEYTANLQAAIDGLMEYVEPTTTEPETTEAPTTRPTEYIEYILGDADGEGYIDIKDATLIQKHLASLATITGKELLAADVDGDESIDIKDATYIQKWLASYEVEFAIGEIVRVEVTPTNPTDEPSTSEPATEPDPSTETFYLPNYVSWLTDMGGKMWVYNDETDEFMLMEYDEDADCFFVELPSDWSVLSFYRTPFDTSEDDFDINSPWDDATQSGIILNKWVELGSRGENNCFKITGDGEGLYTEYNPYEEPDYMRTIYFDNSQTKWSAVYIYGWSFGLSNEWVMMEPVGNDIWAYTFYENLPIDGVKGFLFTDTYASWTGATQTVDLATEEGKNLFVPTPSGTKLSGTWDVYEPAE